MRKARMIAVGVRQLKNGLTHYLRLVDQGQVLLITNRNRAVAVLRKSDRNSAPSLDEKLAGLVAEGKLLPAARPGVFKPFKPVPVKGKPASQIIIEERR
jgi:prevent-host-death family protein